MQTLQHICKFAYDWAERVELPRQVVLRNAHLGFALRGMQLLVVVSMLLFVVSSGSWVKVVEPTKMGVVSVWDDTTENEYGVQEAKDITHPFCASPQSYDFAYSAKWRYENFSCVTPTAAAERFRKEGDSALFVPTARQETRYRLVPLAQVQGGPVGDCSGIAEQCQGSSWVRQAGSDLCKCSTVRNLFVTGVEAFGLTFDHGFEMQNAASTLFESSQTSGKSCEEGESTCHVQRAGERQTQGLLTVLVVWGPDSDGEARLLSVHNSTEPIHARLESILRKAGVSLDNRWLQQDNMLSCSTPGAHQPCREDVGRTPATRLTGLALDVHLHYVNKWVALGLPCTDCLDNHAGPVCKATIHIKQGWHSRPAHDCDVQIRSATRESQCVQNYYHGIQIKFSASGSLGVIDPAFILVSIGALIAYVTIPLIVINYVSVYLLGALSDVYRKACKEEVSLNSQIAGFGARMIIAQAVYSWVTDGDDWPLRKGLLLERIQKCLEHSGQDALDEQEQIRLAELVVHALQGDKEEIGMHQFVEALSSLDPLNCKDTIQLFDVDRKLGIPERLFTSDSWKNQAPRMFETHQPLDEEMGLDPTVAASSARRTVEGEASRAPSASPAIRRSGCPLARAVRHLLPSGCSGIGVAQVLSEQLP